MQTHLGECVCASSGAAGLACLEGARDGRSYKGGANRDLGAGGVAHRRVRVQHVVGGRRVAGAQGGPQPLPQSRLQT